MPGARCGLHGCLRRRCCGGGKHWFVLRDALCGVPMRGYQPKIMIGEAFVETDGGVAL
jgi:hypothetical protein